MSNYNRIYLSKNAEGKPTECIGNYISIITLDPMFEGFTYADGEDGAIIITQKNGKRWGEKEDEIAKKYIAESYHLHSEKLYGIAFGLVAKYGKLRQEQD